MYHHSILSPQHIGVEDILLSRIVVSCRYLHHLFVGIVLDWQLDGIYPLVFFGVFCTVTNFQCQKLVVQQLFPWSGHPMEFRYFCIINRWNWFQLSFSPELNGIGYLSAHYCSSVWQMVVYIAQLCWCVVSCGCDKIWSLSNINFYS